MSITFFINFNHIKKVIDILLSLGVIYDYELGWVENFPIVLRYIK